MDTFHAKYFRNQAHNPTLKLLFSFVKPEPLYISRCRVLVDAFLLNHEVAGLRLRKTLARIAATTPASEPADVS